MNQTALYQTLAQALMVTCPDGFEEARIDAEIDSDWSKKAYSCKVDGEWSQGRSIPAETDFDVDDALYELRDLMQQDGRAAWTSCRFTLKPDGTFNLDVTYPD
ncbi:immunity protein YezG family protein [Altererythrobacter sp. CAU 1778]